MRLKLGTQCIVIIVVAALLPLAAQSPAPKKPLGYDAYDGWKSIQGTRLSRDGTWLVYALVPEDGDGELVAHNLKTGAEFRHPRGKDPVITADGRFAVFAIAPVKADVDKAKKAKKKPEDQPKPGIGIMTLSTGEVAAADRVKNFKVPEDGGPFIAYLLEPPVKKAEAKSSDEKKETEAKPEEDKEGKKKEKKKEPGTDLIVRELATGIQATIPEVSD